MKLAINSLSGRLFTFDSFDLREMNFQDTKRWRLAKMLLTPSLLSIKGKISPKSACSGLWRWWLTCPTGGHRGGLAVIHTQALRAGAGGCGGVLNGCLYP